MPFFQHQKFNEKHLIFKSRVRYGKQKVSLHSKDNVWFWSDRLVLIKDENKKDEEFWNFIVLDLLTTEQRKICFPNNSKLSLVFKVYSLNNESGFIVEDFNGISYVNFVKFNWDTDEFELVEKFNFECIKFSILVDKLNPSKFVLKFKNASSLKYNYQVCKLVGGKIEFGEIHRTKTSFIFYSNNKIVWAFSFEVAIYDLALKEKEKFDFDEISMPRNTRFLEFTSELVNNCFYMAVQFRGTKNYGIAWANLVEKRWYILDFETNMCIEKLQCLNGNLVVNAKRKKSTKGKIYGIPIRKPQSLRQMAWLLIVNVMKNKGKKNPYEKARKFLPLNSDLREPWFEDEEKGTDKRVGIVNMFKNLLDRIHLGGKLKKVDK